jgi:hypothetical protein
MAARIIFILSFTFQIQANILKLICKRKLNTRNKIEYCNITQDLINFSQNKTNAMVSAKTKKRILKAIAMAAKFFWNICLISLIFSCCFFEWSSENTGNSRANIGPISRKGTQIILR